MPPILSAAQSGALMGAFTPEIVSSEGRGDRAAVIHQVFRAARLSFIIISIISIPIFFEIDFILKIWLKNPPEYAALFCRTLLIAFLISSLINGFNAAIAATGKIRNYQIVLSSFSYLSIGVSALLLYLGGGLYSVCGVIIAYNIANMLGNVYFCKKLVGISLRQWLNRVVRPVLLNLSFNILFGVCLLFLTGPLSETLRFFIVSILLVCSTLFSTWKWLIDNTEKQQCKKMGIAIKNKFYALSKIRLSKL